MQLKAEKKVIKTTAGQLEERKKTLGYQVLNLESKTSEINQLCVELVKAAVICKGMDKLLSDVWDYLEFSDMPEITFEAELVKMRKAIYLLCGQTENIQAKLESAAPQAIKIGLHFEWLRAVNKHLSAIKSRLESKITIFNIRE